MVSFFLARDWIQLKPFFPPKKHFQRWGSNQTKHGHNKLGKVKEYNSFTSFPNPLAIYIPHDIIPCLMYKFVILKLSIKSRNWGGEFDLVWLG